MNFFPEIFIIILVVLGLGVLVATPILLYKSISEWIDEFRNRSVAGLSDEQLVQRYASGTPLPHYPTLRQSAAYGKAQTAVYNQISQLRTDHGYDLQSVSQLIQRLRHEGLIEEALLHSIEWQNLDRQRAYLERPITGAYPYWGYAEETSDLLRRLGRFTDECQVIERALLECAPQLHRDIVARLQVALRLRDNQQ